jgi:biotin carboxyl carrier protein
MSVYYVNIGGRDIGFKVGQQAGHTTISAIDGADGAEPVSVDLAAVHSNLQTGEGLYSLLVNHKSYQLYLTPGKPLSIVEISRHRLQLRVLTEREWRLEKIAPKDTVDSGKAVVSAPMPGLVKGVLVERGDEVKIGSRLLVLEAMKMENDLVSPRDGRIAVVHVSSGAIVEGGAALVEIE